MKTLLILPLLFLVVKASVRENSDWWKKTLVYQIYTRSFVDSDGDGVGDINGITSKLKYLKEIGVGSTWISSIFKSPMHDFGYDISDYYEIQNEYGTMQDFENLIREAKELDIKIIVDFVPNHVSSEHIWFQEALKGHKKYYNFFIWEDGIVDEIGTMHPPNNWVSVFRKSAWEYSKEIGKYYFHQFLKSQPDLNYRNPDVLEDINKVLTFWLDKGVAGFRIGDINHLFEVDKELFGGKYPDEPFSGNVDSGPDDYDYHNHIYTKNQHETYDIVYQWRNILDEYEKADGFMRIFMVEIYSTPQNTMKYFGAGEKSGAQMPLNFVLISDLNNKSSAFELKYALDKFMTFKPLNEQANWVASNHDYARAASKFGPELVDGINMIVLLSPGIAVTYFGEEIGMVDGNVSWENTVDPLGCNTGDPILYWKSSRDHNRTPFQWNSEKNAGFSTASKTWLPVAQGYDKLNVEIQRTDKRSHLNIYKELAELRNNKVFKKGKYESVAFNDDVFGFKRWYQNEAYAVVINLRNVSHTIDLTYFETTNESLKIIISSGSSAKIVGDAVNAKHLNITAYESLVLKL